MVELLTLKEAAALKKCHVNSIRRNAGRKFPRVTLNPGAAPARREHRILVCPAFERWMPGAENVPDWRDNDESLHLYAQAQRQTRGDDLVGRLLSALETWTTEKRQEAVRQANLQQGQVMGRLAGEVEALVQGVEAAWLDGTINSDE